MLEAQTVTRFESVHKRWLACHCTCRSVPLSSSDNLLVFIVDLSSRLLHSLCVVLFTGIVVYQSTRSTKLCAFNMLCCALPGLRTLGAAAGAISAIGRWWRKD